MFFYYRSEIYPNRQECGKTVDNFFNLVEKINKYLDTVDFTQEKISLGEQISEESSINKKIKNIDTKKDDGKESNVTTEKNKDEKDGK